MKKIIVQLWLKNMTCDIKTKIYGDMKKKIRFFHYVKEISKK